MSFIVEFYKNLDTVNLFIFWGVIVVVILLLIFSIILSNKNKKLERIIKSKGIDINDFNDDEIPTIKKETKYQENKNQRIIDKVDNHETNNEKINQDDNLFFKSQTNNMLEETKKEKDEAKKELFVAEEHVINYDNKNAIKNHTRHMENNKDTINYEPTISSKPYQKNILREMSLNQTSPIGIVKRDINRDNEIINAKELNDNLNENNSSNLNDNKLTSTSNNNLHTQNENYKRGNYLEELSKNNSKLKEEIERTEYELKQEEDAIISYEELMKKKDNIKTIEEEDAIISINELLKKKAVEEKLYNINNDEDDDKFIDELKNFRSDL